MAHSQQGNESFSKHQFFRGRDEISPWSQAGPPGVHEIPELMLPSSFSPIWNRKKSAYELQISSWYLIPTFKKKNNVFFHIQSITTTSNSPGTPTAVQRKKSSKSHPLQDEPWPPTGAASMENGETPRHRSGLFFPNGSMDLVLRRSRITGSGGVWE